MITILCSEKPLQTLGVREGLALLEADYDFAVRECGEGVRLALAHAPGNELTIECRGREALLRFDFGKRHHFFRAFFLLLERLKDGARNFVLQEAAAFSAVGPMLDLSQGNAALTMQTLQLFLRRAAVMGLSTFWLYCEDSFDVPEEPYFGYMRSRYCYDEWKALDDYADRLGIELIPQVQTLAHLTDVLKWDVYLPLREGADCLIPDDEKTYVFLRHILKAASAPFRTKRIHIGMDEAMELGRGTTLDRAGKIPRIDWMRRHLKRVLEITAELGLEPVMYGDMFAEAGAGAPQGVRFNLWNYYKTDPEWYRALLRQYPDTETILFSGGIWTWYGFAPNWSRTLATTRAALPVMREAGVGEIVATVWGDSGTEADIRLTLAGLQLFAEWNYRGEPTQAQLAQRIRFCVGAEWEALLTLQAFDETPGVEPGNPRSRNPSKFLLWQDPLCGLFDANIRGLPLAEHYAALEARIAAAMRPGAFYDVFELYRRLAHLLTLKSELGVRLYDAYHAGDRAALTRLADEEIPETRRRFAALREQHLRCWMQTCKPLGWEVMDLRYGALLVRLDTAASRVRAWLDGELEHIGELEERRLPFDGEAGIPRNRYTNAFGRIFSAGRIAPEPFLRRP